MELLSEKYKIKTSNFFINEGLIVWKLINQIIESFETAVELSVNFKYMTDYDLGDVVTVKENIFSYKTHSIFFSFHKLYKMKKNNL